MEDLQEDNYNCVVEKIKGLLPKFSEEKKMMIVREFIRSSEGFDYRVLYNMCLKELSTDSEKATTNSNSNPVVLDSEPIKTKGDVFGIKQLHKCTLLRIKLPTVSSIPLSCPGNNHILAKDQKPFFQNHVLIGLKRPRFVVDDNGTNGDGDDRENPVIAIKKVTNLMNRKVDAAITIPEIPEELKQLVSKKNGSNPVFVVQKQLFGSDVDPNKGRLALPLSQLSGEFLTQEEKDFLSTIIKVGGKKPRIQARIFEPCGEEREIYIAKWNMGSVVYSFITTWNQVVKTNSLRDGMKIQLWSFRIDSQLCFLLVKVIK